MTETNFSVTKNGKALSEKLYTWDESAKSFSTVEDDLVLDFSGVDGVTFKTGGNCTFTTESYCTFNTGYCCTFTTGSYCTFTTGSYCTFTTESYCTFTTGDSCTFTTGGYCTFTTGSYCTFTTGSYCTFTTGEKCSLTYTWNGCFEVYKLVPNRTVKILKNGSLEDVFPPKKKISLELTDEQIESLKLQGII